MWKFNFLTIFWSIFIEIVFSLLGYSDLYITDVNFVSQDFGRYTSMQSQWKQNSTAENILE